MLEIFLQRPTVWPMASRAFASAMSGNATELYNYLIRPLPRFHPIPGPNPPSSPWPTIAMIRDLSRLAVTCLDSPRPTSEKEFPTAEDLTDQGLKTLKEVSEHFGLSTGVSEPDGGCQYWPVDGPERFTGPWNASLEREMLIVSNTADP
ncbi:hypothetical protein GYMLUDRAFT_547800 [Collybiopsis luxurians FD-317 M1]|nr:hypothetical protein GYMLUDRAFT_547800 [Collybiopsis luxurians FD-317 M1]